MKIPKDTVERFLFYGELATKCMTWLPNLKPYYHTMRNYYERGITAGDANPIFNNIYPHIDNVTSMLYAQDTTRFSVIPDATESADIFKKCPITARRVQQEWHDSNADLVAGEAVKMSLVYNTSFVKLIINNKEIHPYTIDPEMFGVLREDVQFLSRQQACVHRYHISRAALESQLMDHPRRDQILAEIVAMKTDANRQDTGLDRILVSATTPNIVGQAVLPWMDVEVPQPDVDEPLVEMRELYVWDDDQGDYRVVTVAEPSLVIYERHCDDTFIKGELPFIQFCPNPQHGNFRGISEVGKLRPLQDILNERLWNIRKILNRQADPPKVGTGLLGPADEIAMALSDPGSFTNADGSYNLKELSPQMPPDLYAEVDRIFAMMDMTSGLTPSMQGKPQPGTRSSGQFQDMARVGSTRVKKRALIIEDSIERMATLMFKALRRYSDDSLIDAEGKPFLIRQMPTTCEIKVDAHSSSPVFMEDLKNLAFALFKANAIDSEALLDMTAPPNSDMLKNQVRERSKMAAIERKQQHDEDIKLFLATGKAPPHPSEKHH